MKHASMRWRSAPAAHRYGDPTPGPHPWWPMFSILTYLGVELPGELCQCRLVVVCGACLAAFHVDSNPLAPTKRSRDKTSARCMDSPATQMSDHEQGVYQTSRLPLMATSVQWLLNQLLSHDSWRTDQDMAELHRQLRGLRIPPGTPMAPPPRPPS